MNVVLGLLGLASAYLLAGIAEAQGGCSRITVRRDIMSLSPPEWDRIANVLRRMDADGWFEYYANIHNGEFNNIHGNDNFFPFHRRLLRDFEEVGQRYDSEFAIPFWDEMRDSRNPAGSPVLSPRLLGGNGFGGCVRDGVQAGWSLGFPNRHCLVRSYDRGGQMQSWYSPEYIYSIMQRYNDMHGFREHIEFSLHGSVHLGMGGDMGTYWSANDFAFWLHHANLDRLWSEWQSWGHGSTMDGVNHFGWPMSLGSAMPHYGEPAGSTVNLGSGRMCFQYAGGSRRRSDAALSFVSTPAESSALAPETRLWSLPQELRRKWFPRMTEHPVQPGNTGARNITKSSHAIPPTTGKPLARPGALTEMWIMMHGFNRTTVANIMHEACQFVDEMNAAKYLSPY
ncbi:hypothetical protein LPJ61_004527 [Coemansia biformis]|uniref:Tyrosinase copper-binding domain-containing protein n=1 Tax=Coemansia biformis TaxID=1286918 RepID=A0A9W8CUL2_9FUNG|nr:hypothetical protein LPJ61_004527 [Coemansia biformis]